MRTDKDFKYKIDLISSTSLFDRKYFIALEIFNEKDRFSLA